MAGYDYDNLHVEIDNAAAELNLDPFEALDVWHMGVAQWKNENEQAHAAEPKRDPQVCKCEEYKGTSAACPLHGPNVLVS